MLPVPRVPPSCHRHRLQRAAAAPLRRGPAYLRRDLALSLASNGVVIPLAMGIYGALMHLAGVHHVIAKVLSNDSFLVNYAVRRSS